MTNRGHFSHAILAGLDCSAHKQQVSAAGFRGAIHDIDGHMFGQGKAPGAL